MLISDLHQKHKSGKRQTILPSLVEICLVVIEEDENVIDNIAGRKVMIEAHIFVVVSKPV